MSEEYSALLELAGSINPPLPYWLVGKDDGQNYCRDCAEGHLADEGIEGIEGGCEPAESDTCEHCDDCGKLLAYILTDEGVANELQHFSEVHRWRTGLDPEAAWHIAAMVWAAPGNPAVHEIARRADAVAREQGA